MHRCAVQNSPAAHGALSTASPSATLALPTVSPPDHPLRRRRHRERGRGATFYACPKGRAARCRAVLPLADVDAGIQQPEHQLFGNHPVFLQRHRPRRGAGTVRADLDHREGSGRGWGSGRFGERDHTTSVARGFAHEKPRGVGAQLAARFRPGAEVQSAAPTRTE